MTEYTTIKISKEAVKSIQHVQACMAVHGIEHLPNWLQDVLLGTRTPLSSTNTVTAGIVLLALMERGKTIKEIKQMTREEVNNLLEEGMYPIRV